MGIFNRLGRKISKEAGYAVKKGVKKEAKKAALDMLPTFIAIGGCAAGILIFRKNGIMDNSPKPVCAPKPSVSRVNITTNNYFLDSASSSAMLQKLLKEDD